MWYFQVRYDSRVVIYDCKGFIRLATGLRLSGIETFSESGGLPFQDMVHTTIEGHTQSGV